MKNLPAIFDHLHKRKPFQLNKNNLKSILFETKNTSKTLYRIHRTIEKQKKNVDIMLNNVNASEIFYLYVGNIPENSLFVK